jgi:hypothetical protein
VVPAKIDPELLRLLDDVEDGSSVQAIVRLKPQDSAQAYPIPEQTEAAAHQVVDRVQKLVGEQESALSIFRNLGTFMIAARPRFLRELMSQPEVAAVAANRQPGSAMIDPVRKRPATLDEVRTVPSPARRGAQNRPPRKARTQRKKS